MSEGTHLIIESPKAPVDVGVQLENIRAAFEAGTLLTRKALGSESCDILPDARRELPEATCHIPTLSQVAFAAGRAARRDAVRVRFVGLSEEGVA